VTGDNLVSSIECYSFAYIAYFVGKQFIEDAETKTKRISTNGANKSDKENILQIAKVRSTNQKLTHHLDTIVETQLSDN
jgi:hypothetical protein